jgi:4-carboxymuconolactone decarboxylase
MRKEPSAAEKRIGDFAPKLIDLTDRVRFREVWKRQDRSQRDRSLVNASPVWEGSH